MEAQLERAGLEHEFVAATDGRALSAQDLERLVDRELALRAPRWLIPGQVGSCLSHLEVYRRIVTQGLDAALVLEDDAVLAPNMKNLLTWVAQELDRPEVALLYYTAKKPCRLSDRQDVRLPNGSRLLHPIDMRPLNSAMGYVVTRSACLRMIDLTLPIKAGADAWFSHYDRGGLDRVRCVFPRPFSSRTDFKSTIDYLGPNSRILRLTTAISARRVFPLHQMLGLRRAMIARKASRFSVVQQPSPYAER